MVLAKMRGGQRRR